MNSRSNDQLNRTCISRHKQSGVVLFFALIALVVMSLAAVALIRSADTGGTIAGNLGFKQATMFSADRGVENAMENWLLQISSDLTVDNTANGYYASIADVNGDTVVDNNQDARKLVDDNGFDDGEDADGNQISYVIQRMCKSTGAFDPALCLTVRGDEGKNQTIAGTPCGEICTAAEKPLYRVTAKVVGPRNTVSYIQAFLG